MIAESENATAIGHLERLRLFELERVREWLPPQARVLELGGGSGFQASVIASWGCDVAALDVSARPTPAHAYFPVQEYDGRNLPFDSDTFDVVFSSNVLEHIRDLSGSLAESHRVLKHGGKGVHVLPTPAWRGWTSVTHYARMPQLAWRRLRGARAANPGGVASPAEPPAPRGSLAEVVRRNLLPGPHGEYPSAFSELWFFSRKRWLEVFAASGFEVEHDYPTGLFYTGYSLWPSLSLKSRQALSRVLGSSCRVFVMRKSSAAEPGGSAIPLLVLNRRFGTGGAERQLVTLLRHIDRQRFAVTAASLYEGGDLAAEVRAIPGLAWKPLAKRGRWDLLPFLARYWRLLSTTRPHVIYAFLAVSNVLALLGRMRGAKVVWGIRASDMDASQYDWLERVVFFIERHLARFADLIIANSEAGARYIAARGFPRDRIEVVPNGIDVARFRPDPEARRRIRSEWEVSNDHMLVGLVARLDPMKDHETFLAAAARLAREREDVRFVCVGDGSPAYSRQLMDRSRALGLADRLRWTGARSDMAAVYSALDVLCLSSAFGEGFPNVIGEAMACGVPCVATDVGDAHAVIAETGMVVPPRDPEALARAVAVTFEELQRDREELQARVRRRIVREYSVEHMVSRTEKLLAALVADQLLPES